MSFGFDKLDLIDSQSEFIIIFINFRIVLPKKRKMVFSQPIKIA